MGILIFIVSAAIMALIAIKKGFNPLAWILAAGLIGIIILLSLPSAKEPGLDEETIQKRIRKGNHIGNIISIIVIVILIVIFVAMYNS